MAQILNGVLYVESFTPTGNPGEYTFENGVYNIQNDPLQEGSFGITLSYVLFAPVVDGNTFTPIPGQVARYKFTSLTPVNATLISGTVLFDEDGVESGVPGNGVFCLVSETTPNRRLAVPPLDDIYSDLVKGGTISAMLNDLVNILDKASGGGGSSQFNTPVPLTVAEAGQTVFTLPYDPVNLELSMMIVNGVVYSYGAGSDFTVSGRVITWRNNMFALAVNDTVIFR
jgi:hypothetical protein